ncbi:MAG: AraC family transcriptional regulator [Clostridiales bacterium]|nr:helix-turn-helix domain-containing protein [Clostridiales bacterium]MDU3239357.1 AraC family transcriptional regulator [Clostridiales bacterium]
MQQSLIKRLKPVTEEEQRILTGDRHIQKEIYTTGREFTVDSAKMLEKGRLIDIRTHTRFIAFPSHKHNYIEIMYMCAGETSHVINGTTKVTLKEGDLLFMNQFSSHEILAAKEEDIGINFIILPEFFDEVLPMLTKGNVLSNFLVSTLRKNTNTAGYLHYKVAQVLPIQNLIENLVWSLLNHQPNYRQINQTTMGLLFMQLVNATDCIEAGNQEQHQDLFIMQVLKYIEENYKVATLSEIAGEMNQSVSNMSKQIKHATGRTFKELLQEKRLSQAEHLIRDTTIPITDIIYLVGYDNTSYFHRIFKENYHMSPKSYRKAIVDNSGNSL